VFSVGLDLKEDSHVSCFALGQFSIVVDLSGRFPKLRTSFPPRFSFAQTNVKGIQNESRPVERCVVFVRSLLLWFCIPLGMLASSNVIRQSLRVERAFGEIGIA